MRSSFSPSLTAARCLYTASAANPTPSSNRIKGCNVLINPIAACPAALIPFTTGGMVDVIVIRDFEKFKTFPEILNPIKASIATPISSVLFNKNSPTGFAMFHKVCNASPTPSRNPYIAPLFSSKNPTIDSVIPGIFSAIPLRKSVASSANTSTIAIFILSKLF